MTEWTHDSLCDRAARWLSGTMRCNPVLNRCASACEVPDAIGWASMWNHHGSIVVECKISVGDWRADAYKLFPSRVPDPACEVCHGVGDIQSMPTKEWPWGKRGMCLCRKPLKMGDFRYFMVPDGLISIEDMEKYPDHGLLWVKGRAVKVKIKAPRREERNVESEIRLLRFAVINNKPNLSESRNSASGEACQEREKS